MTSQSRILGRVVKPGEAARSLANEYSILGLLLLTALVHGLLYVFIMPPWQHYDEPNNFEYAWLIANHPGLPEPDDFDQTMRREVAISMWEHGFFQGMDITVDPNSPNPPIWIGYSQIEDQPLYYMLVAFPLRLMGSWDVTAQMYAGRLVSLALYLVTIFAVWGFAREIASPGSAVRWILPVTVIFIPAFTDLMTAVNNDAAAVAFFSLFLWGSVRTVKRGISIVNLFWVVGTAILCYYTKSTVYIALLLVPVALLFGILRGRRRWLAWTLVGIGSLVALASVASWGGAAYWYRSTDQASSIRAAGPKSALGDHVLEIQTKAEMSPRWYRPVVQPLTPGSVKQVAGRQATLGAWMWATEPVQTTAPVLNDGKISFSQSVMLTEEPAFYAFTVSLPEDIWRLWLTVGPALDPLGENVSIYYDGIVLAEGLRPVDEPPQFSDVEGNFGVWGGQPFTNLLRNGSAEIAGPRFHPWIEKAIVKAFPSYSTLSFTVYYLFDWQGAGWHYWAVGARLFRTFWGYFGWGNAPLLGHKPYRVLLAFTLLAFIGAGIYLYRHRKSLLWAIIFILSLTLLGIWMGAFVRGVSLFATNRLWLPVARYAYPAIIPTALIFSIGWMEILRLFERHLRFPRWAQYALYTGLLVTLNIWSLVSIIKFYL